MQSSIEGPSAACFNGRHTMPAVSALNTCRGVAFSNDPSQRAALKPEMRESVEGWLREVNGPLRSEAIDAQSRRRDS